jgi:Domain of unknown function (DUF397)
VSRYAAAMTEFRKSSACAGGECVEVAFRAASQCSGGNCVEVGSDGTEVLVRDSKDRKIPPLRFNAGEWSAFVAGVRAGEFDLPI